MVYSLKSTDPAPKMTTSLQNGAEVHKLVSVIDSILRRGVLDANCTVAVADLRRLNAMLALNEVFCQEGDQFIPKSMIKGITTFAQQISGVQKPWHGLKIVNGELDLDTRNEFRFNSTGAISREYEIAWDLYWIFNSFAS